MNMARKKIQKTMTFDQEFLDRVDAWVAAQPFPPAKNAFFVAAAELLMKQNPVKDDD